VQFIADGPDIPNELLQAHEEGRVVFFCGAGISYPAGLPGFGGLVECIYDKTGTVPTPLEDKAFKNSQFDATLNLLEDRLPGQRRGLAMRKALAEALKPKLRKKGATDTHAALLHLARNRQGMLRLVTTNFDRVFEWVAKRERKPFVGHVAPMLPVPKSSRWDGLVYLHGALPEKPDDSSLNRLVVTSGDFGLAYLTERWAARFVSELFRNYVVCFVGYSINDPVMRYMMDALAADRMLGEVTPQAWALGECTPGDEANQTIEWKAKGVNPILYAVPAGTRDHSALHRTLKVWAETYRDGVNGKEQIVVSHALARPSASTRQDDFVGRMLWALSDKTGIPAQKFADFNPVPSLDWLFDAFTQDHFGHTDLRRFDVPPQDERDDKLAFSLTRRPAPYSRSPWMQLTPVGTGNTRWDDVMFNLARWLVRHLNDPALILWIAKQGGQLGSQWRWLVSRRLDELAELESAGKHADLAEIRANAPQAIPSTTMRRLWQLVLSGRVKGHHHDLDLYQWHSRLSKEGLTTALRLELRELLSPRITLSKPFRIDQSHDESDEPSRIRDVVNWELVLVADHVHSSLRDAPIEQWSRALPLLAEDLQLLLRDALELRQEMGDADALADNSYWDLPSISPHPQNRGFQDWVVLIELLRDAWLAIRESQPRRARDMATQWFGLPYPTFKRLAFFAASQVDAIPSDQWVDWLLSDGAWWLWSVDTRREVLALLRLQGNLLSATDLARLEGSILAGPPRNMFSDSIEADEWQDMVNRYTWIRLTKLSANGVQLGQAASDRQTSLSTANPAWRLSSDHRDEFSTWSSGTGDPDYERETVVEQTPVKAAELVPWLKKPRRQQSLFFKDTWKETCEKHPINALHALANLAAEGEWPLDRWRTALQVWGEPKRIKRTWRYAACVVNAMPEDIMVGLAHQVSWWLKEASSSLPSRDEALIALCTRFLQVPVAAESGMTRNGEPLNQPVTEAINHPVGHVTQALLNQWYKAPLNDGDLLSSSFEMAFTQLCHTRIERFRHGRVLLSAHVIALFRVDQAWTERHLLKLFDWHRDATEARAAWQGFLWTPRLYLPLMIAIKPFLIETASQYSALGDHGRQYAAFLTYAALEPADGFAPAEFRAAFGALPPEGLREAAQALAQAQEGAGEQREEYWKNRLRPFWNNVWPKNQSMVSAPIAERLARIAIGAGSAFPDALQTVRTWLLPVAYPDQLTKPLKTSGLCRQFPDAALDLLDVTIAAPQWVSDELLECLQQISAVKPSFQNDARHQRLIALYRMKHI